MNSQPDLSELGECFTNSPPISLTPSQEDRLLFLLADNENHALLIKQSMSFILQLINQLDNGEPKAKPSQINKQNYQRYLQTSEFCAELADRSFSDFGLKAQRLFGLMAKYYELKAEEHNPNGKRQRTGTPQNFVAHFLVSFITKGEIDVRLAVNPTSDLSKLFQLCCEIIGLKASSNTSFYLSPAIKRLAESGNREIEQINRQIREELGMASSEWV